MNYSEVYGSIEEIINSKGTHKWKVEEICIILERIELVISPRPERIAKIEIWLNKLMSRLDRIEASQNDFEHALHGHKHRPVGDNAGMDLQKAHERMDELEGKGNDYQVAYDSLDDKIGELKDLIIEDKKQLNDLQKKVAEKEADHNAAISRG